MSEVEVEIIGRKISGLPANGTLAVGRALGDAERLADLRLREPQRQPAQLEGLRELLDLVQVDPVDDVVRGFVDRWLICNYSQRRF